MGFADTIRVGREQARPLRCLIHSVPGAGKTHLAAGAPMPLFLDCERGTLELDVARVEVHRYNDVVEAVRYLRSERHDYRTLVVDTLDALERTLAKKITGNDQVTNLDKVGGGYGKGWSRAVEDWKLLQDTLDALQRERGVNVLILAHSHPGAFSDPDGDDYNRWTLRVNKKTHGVWEGWVDEILFLHREVRTEKNKRKGHGGRRVLHTAWSPGRLAKSRRGFPPELTVPDASPTQAWAVIGKAAREAIVASGPVPSEPTRRGPPPNVPEDLPDDVAEDMLRNVAMGNDGKMTAANEDAIVSLGVTADGKIIETKAASWTAEGPDRSPVEEALF